jgi:Zinc carboxypeptidase
MPPQPPVRPGTNPYHFHTYDYVGSAANGPFQPSPPQPTAGNWQFYSMVQDLQGLLAVGQARNVPNIALNNVAGQTARHRNTMMLSFGNQAAPAPAPTVVITGGIHAREWIATEIAYLIAEYLIVNYPGPAAPLPLTQYQTDLKQLVDTRTIDIIPMVNPDGNRRTVFGNGANDRFWRKNRRRLPALGQTWIHVLAPGGVATAPFASVRYWTQPVSVWAQYRVPDYDPANHIPPGAPPNYRNRKLTNLDIGVDLNRNMATTAWGYDCAPYPMWDPAGIQFFGTRPGGEAETSNVQQAMVAAAAGGVGGNLSVTIDYHAYARAVLYPSETAHAGLGPLYTGTGQMLQSLIRNQIGAGTYLLGAPLNVAGLGYDATGTVADYAAQQHQATAFTIELDPWGNLGDQGFVLQENQIQPVFEKNIRAALAAVAAPATPVQAANYTLAYAWPTWNQGNQLP